MTTTRKKPKETPRLYLAETNRALRDNIRWVVDYLERHGITVTRIRHLTTLLLGAPALHELG